MTVHERVAAARTRLRAAGLRAQEAELDARLLAQFALGWDAVVFSSNAQDPEPPGFADTYESLVLRRAAREPLAYITGRREFWGLDIELSPDVLIPRPETELLVEQALKGCADRTGTLVIADVGTGSGCIAVALARELPGARIVAIDESEKALAVAQRNARKHGVADRIDFVQTDVLDGVSQDFGLIVSNPPYVREGDRRGLQPEVGDHEPAGALFGGPDGLDIIRKLLEQSVSRLKIGGRLLFEFGYGHFEEVPDLIEGTSGLKLVELASDLQGIPRVAVVVRR